MEAEMSELYSETTNQSADGRVIYLIPKLTELPSIEIRDNSRPVETVWGILRVLDKAQLIPYVAKLHFGSPTTVFVYFKTGANENIRQETLNILAPFEIQVLVCFS